MIERPWRLDLEHGPLVGVTLVPEGPPPRSAVVLVHDFLGGSERDFLPWLAAALASDHAVVRYTSPGSGIGPSGTHTELDRLASSTHTRELAELARVIDGVRSGAELPRPPRTIGLVGHGRGGAHALLHSAAEGSVDALVTWNAPSRLDRWNRDTREIWRRDGRIYVPAPGPGVGTGRQLPLGVELLEDTEARGAELDPLAAAPRVAAPWLLVQGVDDAVVDRSEARVLRAAAPRASLVEVPGGDHLFGGREPFAGAGPPLEAALAATRRHLRRFLVHEVGRADP